MYHSYVSKIMEKRFIPMLVKYFPDQAGKVVKYIRKAGYGDGEVLDLIEGSRPHRPNGWIQLQHRLPLPGEKRGGTQEKASAKNTEFLSSREPECQ
ncbi:MAG: hypothetical protein BHW66_04195 [Akkermansia sp. 54_46]|nr:MAG: hypothetical protein BHW66_04195 [Akkermansia sp. 54_46]